MKKSMIIVGLVLILSMSFISAGLFDNWFGRISGKVTYDVNANTKLLLHLDSDFSDSSNSKHTVTPKGDAKIVEDRGAYFDGSGDYLSIPDSADFHFGSGDFTIDFWMKTSSVGPVNLVSKWIGGSGSSNDAWSLDAYLNNIRFVGSSGSGMIGSMTSSGVNVADNAWHHIAIVRSGSNWYTFIDGTQRATASSATIMADGTTDLGVGVASPQFNYGNYIGYIDKIRISKGIARWTSDFSSNLPNRESVVVEPEAEANTKLLLHLDSDFSDSSNSKHSVITNGDVKIDGTNGAYFDGSGDYLSFSAGSGSDFDFGTNDFTIDLWFYPTGSYTYSSHFMGLNGGGPGMELIFEATPGTGSFTWGVGSSSATWPPNLFWKATGSVGDLSNSWHHVAMVRSGSTFILFLDGTQIDTAISSGTIGYPGTYWIGEGYGGGYVKDLKGYIDEYRISKGVARWTTDFSNNLPARISETNDEPTCTNLCPVENEKTCSQNFNGYNLCIDTNSDGCFELKSVECKSTEKCSGGICTLKNILVQCQDQCTPKNSKKCNQQEGYDVCLDTNNDGCTEGWVSYSCFSDEICDAVTNECVKKGCVAETKEETCGAWECGVKKNNCGAEIACGNQCVDSICNEGICSSIDNCRGCEYKKTCVSYGFRTSDLEINLGASSYCNVEGIFIGQKQDEQSCQNNYECLSNQCSDGVCVGLVKEIRAQTSLLWRILCTMFNPISDTDKQACFDKHSVIVED